jgi:regulator of sigma E protease
LLLITLIAFLFILAFSITIHEFGHFIVAKLVGIPVEKFSLGFGPPIVRMQIGETDFRIAYFPLGGYVKFAGEDEGEIIKPLKEIQGSGLTMDNNTSLHPSKPGFYDVPIYKRIAVVFSGPLFNILSAFLLFAFILCVFGVMITPYLTIYAPPGSAARRYGFLPGDSIVAVNNQSVNSWDEVTDRLYRLSPDLSIKLLRDHKEITLTFQVPGDSLELRPLVPPVIGYVKFNGPAYKAGIKTGDQVTKINDREIRTWDEMVDIIRKARGVNLTFEWLHQKEQHYARIAPGSVYDPLSKDTIGQIGVMMPLKRQYIPLPNSIGMSFRKGADITWLTLKTLYLLVKGEIPRKALGGPIAIARLSGESASWGIDNLFGLLAIISINLGLVNLFPLPAFDGGQIIIALFEGIRRKRLSRKTRLVLQQIGYAIILLLIIFVTYNDITR